MRICTIFLQFHAIQFKSPLNSISTAFDQLIENLRQFMSILSEVLAQYKTGINL